MADKPKVAICWLGSCGGCDETIVDINEKVLDVAKAIDFVFWPVAMDFKYHHIEAMKDGEIDLCIINGHVRNQEQKEVAELLRKKSKLVLAFGACACFGGTPGLANFRDKEDIFDWVYRDCPTAVNPRGIYPQTSTSINGNELTLPEFFGQVYPLKEIIDVDYYLPGCPPPPNLVLNAITAVLENKLPPKGSTLAHTNTLCQLCPRNESKPTSIDIKSIKRIHEVEADPNICFLAQGIICFGPATRGGCGESCIRVNMPCRGCFGPVDSIEDPGTKFISGLVSILDTENDDDIKRMIAEIADPAGYLYRFTLPVSIINRKIS